MRNLVPTSAAIYRAKIGSKEKYFSIGIHMLLVELSLSFHFTRCVAFSNLIMIGKRVQNRYIIQQAIGQGHFCTVYQAVDPFTLSQVAVKVLKDPCGEEEMALEASTLTALGSVPGIPKLLETGTSEGRHYAIMELLDTDLYSLMQKRKQLPVQVILSTAHAAIKILKSIHSAGYLHLDIKPDNIGVKRVPSGHQVYLLDLGLARKYQFDGIHCREGPVRELRGNPIFASIPVMKCMTPSRRDDLESLLYTLAFMGNGDLPWRVSTESSSRESWRTLAVIKQKCSSIEICCCLPSQFAAILTQIRLLPFEAKPAYRQYIKQIEQAAAELSISLNSSSAWDELLSASGKLPVPSQIGAKALSSDVTPRSDMRHNAIAPVSGFPSPNIGISIPSMNFPTPHLSQCDTLEESFMGRRENRNRTLKKQAKLVLTPTIRRHIEAIRAENS